jgi:predicted acetyltransferase
VTDQIAPNLDVQRPSHEMVESFVRMRDAHMAIGENEWTHRGAEIAHTDPNAFVDLMNDRAAGRRIAKGFVRADEFWIVEGGEVVGTLGVRHELTERLRQMGGHIGYSTHPDHRGRGIATFALRHGLEVLAGLGVTEALVTCDENNAASARVIEKCGGQRIGDAHFTDKPDLKRRRYIFALQAEIG